MPPKKYANNTERRAARTEEMRIRRSRMSEEERSLRRKRNTEAARMRFASMTDEDRLEHRRQHAEAERIRMASMTEEERAAHREKRSEVERLRVVSMTEQERAVHRRRQAETKRRLRAASMTDRVSRVCRKQGATETQGVPVALMTNQEHSVHGKGLAETEHVFAVHQKGPIVSECEEINPPDNRIQDVVLECRASVNVPGPTLECGDRLSQIGARRGERLKKSLHNYEGINEDDVQDHHCLTPASSGSKSFQEKKSGLSQGYTYNRKKLRKDATPSFHQTHTERLSDDSFEQEEHHINVREHYSDDNSEDGLLTSPVSAMCTTKLEPEFEDGKPILRTLLAGNIVYETWNARTSRRRHLGAYSAGSLDQNLVDIHCLQNMVSYLF